VRGAKFRRGFAVSRLAVNVINLLLKLVFVIVVSVASIFSSSSLTRFCSSSVRTGSGMAKRYNSRPHPAAQLRHTELSPAPALLLLKAGGEHGEFSSQQRFHQRRIGKGAVLVAEQIGVSVPPAAV
jgi:hypothetical protein